MAEKKRAKPKGPCCPCSEFYGPNIPVTDEEIEAFEKEHGPPPPLSQEFMDRVMLEVLRRVRSIESARRSCLKRKAAPKKARKARG